MMNTGLRASETSEGLTVHLHVLPRAKRSEFAGLHNGALKLKVTAPPVDDAANRAIIEFFAELLGVSKSSLKILAGNKSREKVLQIKGISLADFIARIPGGHS
ncbi:MAG TPA: DUF167 domain-containing protein [Acidobacteriota bacterium]|nr:DUF167 domain-containing protein [Acidobacteriota bacterium]